MSNTPQLGAPGADDDSQEMPTCKGCGHAIFFEHAHDCPIVHPQNDVLKTLTERAKWYRDGCEGLEDRDGYYASGDCARDAASDLETALSEIRVLEAVIAKFRGGA